MIVHKIIVFELSPMQYHHIFKSRELSYLKPTNFNNILLILGNGYGLCFHGLFRLIKLLIKCTLFYLGLGFANYGDPYSESLSRSRTPSTTKLSTSF